MGEIVWTTDGQQLWVGDGLTQGGSPVVGPNVVGYGLAYDATTRRIEVAGLSADDITNGVNNKFFATELAQDAAASLFVTGTHSNISFVYDDALGKINATVTLDGIGLTDIIADTTPQLGGNLDLNSSDITGTGDIDIVGDVVATSVTGGSVVLQNNTVSLSEISSLDSGIIRVGNLSTNLNAVENYSDVVALISTTSDGGLASSGMFENKTSRGTTETPTACQTSDYIGGYGMAAYTGSAYETIGLVISQLDTVTGSAPNPGKVLLGARGANGVFVGASLDSRGVFESQSFRVIPFANGAARDLALPTEVVKAGMICFLTDVKKLQINTDGTTGTWVDLN
jgi:hypothetical protein